MADKPQQEKRPSGDTFEKKGQKEPPHSTPVKMGPSSTQPPPPKKQSK
jgi:hypothetical protein